MLTLADEVIEWSDLRKIRESASGTQPGPSAALPYAGWAEAN